MWRIVLLDNEKRIPVILTTASVEAPNIAVATHLTEQLLSAAYPAHLLTFERKLEKSEVYLTVSFETDEFIIDGGAVYGIYPMGKVVTQ